MKKFLSSVITVVVLIVGAFIYINDDTSNGDFDIKGIITKLTTGSIENTKEDKELINEKTNQENYKFINNNKTVLSDEDNDLLQKNGDDKFWADYPSLDKYGRAGKVTALVTHDSVMSHSSKVQERPSFSSSVHVAGEYKDGQYDAEDQTWRGNISNNKILQLEAYRGYIYNKSHSLAWSLGGDMETHNITLGTRSQNVGSNRDSNGGGMGYSETQIRNAIYDKNGTKVFYEVTPVYKDKELVPRGSHVRAYSINDNGKTVNLNVWVSNTENGIDINYNDGTYRQE